MRKLALIALTLAGTAGLFAQNTDIESLAGLQFNFGNPGARSLGMGGAFLGLADDASAAEANPAGLTILRKPEFSIEGRNFLEQQILTTSGTFPNLKRTAFNHYSQRVDPTFASFVYPFSNFVIGAYYHEPLRNEGAGQVVPQRNPFTNQVESSVPVFYLPKNGTPVSARQCQDIVNMTNDFTSCLEYAIKPFLTSSNVQERTFGLAGAYKFGTLSVGANVRYQTFRETSLTFRLDQDFNFDSISIQATGKLGADGTFVEKDQKKVTFGAGFKWAPVDQFSVGGVYKQGPRFNTPTYAATNVTNQQFVQVGATTFHIPDVYGVGVSYRPIPALTLNADGVHIKYSNLVDKFISVNSQIRQLDKAYRAADVTEEHFGAEYFFTTKIPFALRAGLWRDPAHSIVFQGPLTSSSAVADAILYPKGQSQMHESIGAGLAWPKYQIDAAYDRSQHFKVGSISMVFRF